MSLSEELLVQARVFEEAEKGGEVAPDIVVVKSLLFKAAEEVDKLSAKLTEKEEELTAKKGMVELGELKIRETKDDTLRLLNVIGEHSKDTSRHDRMKERFEKEELKFEDVKRYHEDAQAEFDKLFPAEGRAKGSETDDGKKDERNTINIAPYKI